MIEHFGDMEKIGASEINLKFKEISYETIYDLGFRTALEKSKIPKNRLVELFSEQDAAPGTSGELF